MIVSENENNVNQENESMPENKKMSSSSFSKSQSLQKKIGNIENIEISIVDSDYEDSGEIINNYINDLTESGKLSKYNIEDAKVEQEKITQEVDLIRAGLDEIMNDTEYVGAQLKKKIA